jgi:hypothetical protein
MSKLVNFLKTRGQQKGGRFAKRENDCHPRSRNIGKFDGLDSNVWRNLSLLYDLVNLDSARQHTHQDEIKSDR